MSDQQAPPPWRRHIERQSSAKPRVLPRCGKRTCERPQRRPPEQFQEGDTFTLTWRCACGANYPVPRDRWEAAVRPLLAQGGGTIYLGRDL